MNDPLSWYLLNSSRVFTVSLVNKTASSVGLHSGGPSWAGVMSVVSAR